MRAKVGRLGILRLDFLGRWVYEGRCRPTFLKIFKVWSCFYRKLIKDFEFFFMFEVTSSNPAKSHFSDILKLLIF